MYAGAGRWRRPAARDALLRAASSVHPGPAGVVPRLGERRGRLTPDPRHAAEPDGLPHGLPVPPALPVRPRALCLRSCRCSREIAERPPASACRLRRGRSPACAAEQPVLQAGASSSASRSGGAWCCGRRSARCMPSTDVSLELAEGRDPRHGRRVGLRQVDAGPAAAGCTTPTAGKVLFDGQRPRHAARSELRRVRRAASRSIFQDPYGSLNPRMTVGAIIGEPFVIHSVVAQRRSGERGCRSCCERSASTRSTQPLPARVLRRPAAADRDRPGAGAAARS